MIYFYFFAAQTLTQVGAVEHLSARFDFEQRGIVGEQGHHRALVFVTHARQIGHGMQWRTPPFAVFQQIVEHEKCHAPALHAHRFAQAKEVGTVEQTCVEQQKLARDFGLVRPFLDAACVDFLVLHRQNY